MRGIRHYNFPAFDEAADGLRDLGHTVISPADLDRNRGFYPEELPDDHDWSRAPADFDFDACVQEDIEALLQCSAVMLLPGWRDSKGACAELAVARWRGIPAYEYDGDWSVDIHDAQAVGKCAAPLPSGSKERLDYPICTGMLMYFPRACAAVARHSKIGNDQHNPGEPMHWAREKSIGRGDQIVRHLMDGLFMWDSDREETEHHFAGMAWRSLELLERFLAGYEPFREEDR